jgi:type IV pilus assembly protein PilX
VEAALPEVSAPRSHCETAYPDMNENLNMTGYHKNQSGVVLIIGLIILLLLTLIAITVMRVTALEERMAGNMLNQNIAFQSAESALREAEAYIAAQAVIEGSAFRSFKLTNGPFQNTGDPICASGLCGPTTPPQSDIIATLSAENMMTAGTTITSIYAEPRFIIEYIRSDPRDDLGANIYSVVFRITARAQGEDPNSFAVLQSTYRQPLRIAR